MKRLLPIALVLGCLVQACPQTSGSETATTAGPLWRERWQRVLTPPAGLPRAEQCVVLDADVFAHAAPGLRDVRLLQGNRELAYAIDESHDARETGSGPLPLDDRSIFDTVGVAPLGVSSDTGARLRATFLLPPHVPVERITLRGATAAPLQVHVSATPQVPFQAAAPESEIVHLEAAPGRLSLPVTLGANLQNLAAVAVVVAPAVPQLQSVAFEMRRREICFQPISTEPVRMVFGDDAAQPVHYEYAAHYKPTGTPLLATMGPVETNAEYRQPVQAKTFAFSMKDRLGVAMGLCVGMLIVTMGALIGMRR